MAKIVNVDLEKRTFAILKFGSHIIRRYVPKLVRVESNDLLFQRSL